MVTEALVKESLSSEMIAAGAELTRRLDEARFVVSASLWLYIAETNTLAIRNWKSRGKDSRS